MYSHTMQTAGNYASWRACAKGCLIKQVSSRNLLAHALSKSGLAAFWRRLRLVLGIWCLLSLALQHASFAPCWSPGSMATTGRPVTNRGVNLVGWVSLTGCCLYAQETGVHNSTSLWPRGCWLVPRVTRKG